MLFFGHKKKIEAPEPAVAVETIPVEFWGGVNPVVQFKTTTKTIETPVVKSSLLTTSEKTALDKKTVVGAGNAKHVANLLSNRKFIFVGLGVLFVVFAVGASAYYLIPYFNKPQPVAVAPTPLPEPIAPALPTPTPPEPIVAPQPPAPTPPTPSEVKMEFPSTLLGDSVDYDNDDITDTAEELFMTDLGVSDSDNDKYPDGHEVYYLYNPIGKEPVKLVESNLVAEYVNPVFDYKLYYPKNWAVGNVDVNHRDILFSTLTGENIEVRVFDLAVGQTLSDWMAINAPSERLENLADFVTAFKDQGKFRADSLVYYFTDSKRLYIIAYHTTDSNTINYRIVAKMMARSFRLGSVREEKLTTLPVENEITAGLAPETTATATAEVPVSDNGAGEVEGSL